MPPLRYAVERENNKICELLVNVGADVNYKFSFSDKSIAMNDASVLCYAFTTGS